LHTKLLYAPLPHTRYMFRPPSCFRFDHPNNICWGTQIIMLLFVPSSPLLSLVNLTVF
jgi:hypothetical protein